MDKHLPDAIDEETLQVVPERIVRLFSVLPLAFDSSSITLICPDEPDYLIKNEEEIRFSLNRILYFRPAPRKELESEIDRYFPNSKRDIQNCDVRFRFRCPLRWSMLSPTSSPDQRKCSECNRLVYRCHTKSEVEWHARQGRCVAFVSLHDSEFLGESDGD